MSIRVNSWQKIANNTQSEHYLPTDYRFTGQRREGTIRLYDYGARFYDPLLGRFLSADTVVPQPGNPQALNRYSYVLNNPLKYTDPSGHYVLLEDPVDTPFAHISEFSVRISSDGTIQILSGGQHFRNYYEKSIANYILSEGRTQLPPRPGGMFGGTIGRTVSNVEVGLGYKRPRLGDAVADIATDPMALYGVAMFAGKLTKDAVVIGENMVERIKPYARQVEAQTINDFIPAERWSMEANEAWIKQMRAEGREIIDIGPDFDRRLYRATHGTRPDSEAYNLERRLLQGYEGYHKVFQRSGKYWGGVPGFDWE